MKISVLLLSFCFLLCGEIVRATEILPQRVSAAHAYAYKVDGAEIAVLIQFPTPQPGKERIINWASRDFENLPTKFLIGTGSLNQPFMRVDRSKGSELAKQVEVIKERLITTLKRRKEKITEETVAQYLARNMMRTVLPWPKDITDTKSVYGWAPSPETGAQFDEKFAEDKKKLFQAPIGFVLNTPFEYVSVPFMNVIHNKKGYCMEMALLGSFILESFNIPHRIVFGSVLEEDDEGGGHTWLELKDGRILDVAWGTLDYPEVFRHTDHPDWLWFGNKKGYQYRYRYSFFPIIEQQ